MSALEPALAQKFIEKTAKHLEYNINIMNDKGIIIASKDASRVGNFHEVAFSMLQGTRDSGIINENQKFLGTKPGVNLFIDYKSKHVGVICVTGNPESVHSFANLVKTSMEAMLEYELQMESERRRKDKSESFLDYLLFEDNIDLLTASKMAERIDMNQDQIRTCILIKSDFDYKSGKIVEALTKAKGHSHQDIITIARNDDVILFKAFGNHLSDVVKNYKDSIKEYLQDFLDNIPEGYDSDKISFFIGSMQSEITKYRESFLHAQEMGLQIKALNGIYFFNDYVFDYHRSLATIKAYDNAFNIYDNLFNDEEKKQMVEVVECLRKNNYNIVYSAKALYIHRNTLLFRLNKLKDLLSIDPVSNSEDREFLNELAYYFGHKK